MWVDESQFRANLLAALAFALLLSGLASIRKLREPTIRAIKRAWGFFGSIRLTTSTRIEAALGEAKEEGMRAALEPIQKTIDARRKAFQEAFAAPSAGAPPREPVSWSARRRATGWVVLTNLSSTDTAFHVEVSGIGLSLNAWVPEDPAWEKVEPKETVSFAAGRDPDWPMDPKLLVVWEDAGGRAHEDYLLVVGL